SLPAALPTSARRPFPTRRSSDLHAPAGLKAARLLLVGAGKREPWDSATLRKLAGAALRYLKSRSVRNFAMLVREGQATEESAQVIVEGILTADFESDKYKTDKKKDRKSTRLNSSHV